MILTYGQGKQSCLATRCLLSFPNAQFSAVQFFSPLCSSISEKTTFATVVIRFFNTESAMEKNKQKYTQITIFLRLEMKGGSQYCVETIPH